MVVGQCEKGAATAPPELERVQAEAGDQTVAGVGEAQDFSTGGTRRRTVTAPRDEQRVHELAGGARPEGLESATTSRSS